MMVRTLTMSSQMAHQIHIGVEIRNSTTGIKAEQMASSALCLWIQDLGKIYNSYVTHFVKDVYKRQAFQIIL